MKKMVEFVFIVLPVGGIIWCSCFFYMAFEKTIKGRPELIVNVINVSEPCQSNIVNKCQGGKMYSFQDRCELRSFLEDFHDKIATKEHDRFRAELGTWLSIFGALAILATIMVSSFAYLSQQASLREERERVEKQFEKNISEIKDDMRKLGKDYEDKVKDYEDKADTISKNFDAKVDGNELANRESSADNSANGETNTDFSNRLDKVRRKTGEFCRMFPKTGDTRSPEIKFREKCDLGISVLRDYNSLLEEFPEKKETKATVNKMHTIGNYLGIDSVITSGFVDVFIAAMKENAPLESNPDEIERRVDDKVTGGYYRSLWKLQSDKLT